MTLHKTLIGYAMSFASFLIDSSVGQKIHKIILFGSAARGDFNGESDVDIFIDCDEKLEPDISKLLALFRSSQTYKAWQLKGVKNDLSIKVGVLATWGLRREVISSGITLYSKYSELPGKAQYYALVRIEGLSEKKTSQQMRIFRTIYGYTQKVGKKAYHGKGLIAQAGGAKLGRGVFIIPMERRQDVLSFLNKNRVSYKLHELWSDAFEEWKQLRTPEAE